MPGPTAYFLFCQEHREAEKANLLAETGKDKVSVAEVAKLLGAHWKALSDEERAKYQEAAKTAAAAQPAVEALADESEELKPQVVSKAEHLPLSTVRKIVLCDPEVQRASQDALLVIAGAAEQLLALLCNKGAALARSQKRKTLKLDDFASVVRSDRRLVSVGLSEVHTMVAAAAASGAGKGGAGGDGEGKEGQEQGQQQQQGQHREKGKAGVEAVATAAKDNKQHSIRAFFTAQPRVVEA